MDNPSDNIFTLGLLYKAIMDMRAIQEQLTAHTSIHKRIDKTIDWLKRELIKEIETL